METSFHGVSLSHPGHLQASTLLSGLCVFSLFLSTAPISDQVFLDPDRMARFSFASSAHRCLAAKDSSHIHSFSCLSLP
jgi:hypothetical protein